CMQPLEFLWTF
nr:immunoglobulin light chain junction region [Macaca mulatta]